MSVYLKIPFKQGALSSEILTCRMLTGVHKISTNQQIIIF